MKKARLGSYATAKAAALAVARSPEAAKRRRCSGAANTAVPPLTSEEALQRAQAEGLTLVVAGNKSGYFGVYLKIKSCKTKSYQTQVSRSGKRVSVGSFATPEAAALSAARFLQSVVKG